MTDKVYPKSQIPIRRTVDLLPTVFQTETNDKFLSATLDSLTQPGTLEKVVGYIGRRYGKTYLSKDIYLDTDQTLRSRYQLEPAVVVKKDDKINNFYDYIDFKNQIRFFGNTSDRDDLLTDQDHYSWSPPVDWDKLVNFREYYWVPDGPPPVKILGQSQEIVSTYKVKLGSGSTFIFTPDGLTNNPNIILYRGQSYKFQVNAPNNGFLIRTGYDSGSIAYNPDLPIVAGQFVIFDEKLWRAKVNIPVGDGSTISEENEDWEYIEDSVVYNPLDYNKGVTNNGTTRGTVTFDVPLDAPDVLYYQSQTDPNRFGKFLIQNIDSNTRIDVEKEILGKTNYLSSNGVELSNGMIVNFLGQVTPSKYAEGRWVVEGVGNQIRLIDWLSLSAPTLSADYPEVLFDNAGFDSEPFDDATSYPGTKDYILINRSSQDSNPWSRYNRWFHQEVLKYSHRFNGTDFDAADENRAKRPIIEFFPDLTLLNHGLNVKKEVDVVDTFTTDVFSTIEGSQGYSVDGIELFQGARILVTADTDILANNRIYEVNFIFHSTGSVFRSDWNIESSYKLGESVRYQGQTLTAQVASPSNQVTILSSIVSTKRFKIAKTNDIKVDMAISFAGAVTAGLQAGQVYYITEVFNDDPNSTEFTLSVARQGFDFTPNRNYAFTESSGAMTARFSYHPTDPTAWKLSPDRRQITLKKVDDTDPILNEGVLVTRGNRNRGLMYWFNGSSWVLSQRKFAVNQPPAFDVFDDDGVSFHDPDRYPVSSFGGSSIITYAQGNGVDDKELGFPLSYLNIDNVGDILFNFNWDTESFTYEINKKEISKKVSSGYYKFSKSGEFGNCWEKTDRNFHQAIIDAVEVTEATNIVEINAINWITVSSDKISKILVYINGILYRDTYQRNNKFFTFPFKLAVGDIVSIKVYAEAEPLNGYYEVPIGIEKNPLNQEIKNFTLGQAVDHVSTALDIIDDLKGNYPGTSNLRDIFGFNRFARRFVKHSGISPLALTMLCDKQVNVIKSLEYASKSYKDFKNSFLQFAENIQFSQNTVDFVDEILSAMTKIRKSSDAFSDSDMIGMGAFTSKIYTVEDPEIKIFALNEKFDLKSPSRRAVYVYVNGQQLLHEKDYIFNEAFGFVELLVQLDEDYVIELREYSNTTFSYIPPTPTKLGLYKKYQPEIFLDDTYAEPTLVIRGHDGSITVAYQDYRDDLILELEKRIYNNIKISYNTDIFDIDKIFGGYYGSSVYNKKDLDSLIDRQFRKWALLAKTDSVENRYFDSENSRTYTYSNMFDPQEKFNLPGWWRGVYLWFYDTVRPHQCPWEMLGFTEKPSWWDDTYGQAPYTRDNLILWEDLRDGIIQKGERAGTYDRYKRSTIIDHIPVDENGNLLDPLESGLARNYSLINAKGNFKFGDVSPVEYAWRSSSDFPFAVIIACCLGRPFEFIIESLDKNNVKVNRIGQTVNVTTNLFSTIGDIKLPDTQGHQASGLINYVVDFLKANGLPLSNIQDKVFNIDVNLSTRISGFVDQSQQKYILDSKNPRSTSSSVFIPQENYDIIFNVSVPIQTLTYSGIIIEKTERGFKVSGYDPIDPAFSYYKVALSQSDFLISVGGVSANFVEWEPNKTYSNGSVIKLADSFYRAIRTHTGGDNFEIVNWQKLPKLPTEGAVTAFRRTNFNKTKILTLEYGTTFDNIQSLVDFIFGYEAYLIDQGFDFNQYDPTLAAPRNWTTSVKEFLYWTTHNWAYGSLIALSPAANQIVVNTPVGVADNLLDSFYEYQILQSDGTILPVQSINVNRKFQQLIVETVEDVDGIYLFQAYLVLKEHVTVFDDRTVFNDVIYDKPTGYRQERIKSRGFRTVDWDGDYTSPGFIYDNLNIEVWQPFVDYKLGDIVSYRSYNYVSLKNQSGSLTFNEASWSKLDTNPTKQLISNFDFKASQFEDYYNVDADGTGASQRDLARHAVGYQVRDYLQEMAEDQVTQFNLYQGFVREKGTANAIVKVFDKLSKIDDDSVVLKEEWAFRIGQLGGVDQTYQAEIKLEKSQFKINPQPLIVVEGSISSVIKDQYYRRNQSHFTISPVPFSSSINPTALYKGLSRSAGFVKRDQVDIVVKNRDQILSLDINSIFNESNIWVTFDNNSWTVLRFSYSNVLIIRDINKVGTSVTVSLNRKHNFKVGDIIGIREIVNLTGFFKITALTSTTFTVEVSTTAQDPEFEPSTINYNLYVLVESKYKTYQDVDQRQAALLKNKNRLWIEDGYSTTDKWQVIEKQSQFKTLEVSNYQSINPQGIGTSVVYADQVKESIFGAPLSLPFGEVLCAVESSGNAMVIKQRILPELDFQSSCHGSFGSTLAVSPDNQWLVIGAPLASGVPNKFQGLFEANATYAVGDIVLYQGRLWEAVELIFGDGSTINVYNEQWKSVDIVKGSALGVGDSEQYTDQGAVFLYKRQLNNWVFTDCILSPRMAALEKFGSALSISTTGNKYYLAVTAPGAYDNSGRVYLFTYENNGWRNLENQNYRGIFNINGFYPSGSIVWYSNSQWRAKVDIPGNTSTSIESNLEKWELISPVATQSALPINLANPYDGLDPTENALADSSFPATGLLNDSTKPVIDQTQIIEIVKASDQFGHSVVMNRDGSLLVVGAPNADLQYFENYRGLWSPFQEYKTDDVVRFVDPISKAVSYRKLYDPRSNDDPNTDSSEIYVSINQSPDADPWEPVGDSTTVPTGKVFVYQRNSRNGYDLIQTISPSNLSSINDTGIQESIATGDQFGFSIDMDLSGYSIVVGCPNADIEFTSQGAVYVFRTDNLETPEFRLKQKLQSFEEYPNEFFGTSVSISQRSEKVSVGAKNSKFRIKTVYDGGTTTFDQNKTVFTEDRGNTGQVYVYERKDETYFLVEKLDADLQDFESFGKIIDSTASAVLVGSPDYREVFTPDSVIPWDNDPLTKPASTYTIKTVGNTNWYALGLSLTTKPEPGVSFTALARGEGTGTVVSVNSKLGKIRLFKKTTGIESWKVIAEQEEQVDYRLIKNIAVYDDDNKINLGSLDIIDNYKLQIFGIAEQELSFKTVYDPAVYSVGTAEQEVDDSQAWFEEQVGKLWWDLSTAKFVYHEQSDIAHRINNVNKQVPFSSIDIYEWVESKYTPAQWASLADTAEGLAQGITGVPKYPDNSVHSVKILFNIANGEQTGTKYFFWVKNKTIVPENIPTRRISAAEVSNLISSPQSSGKPFISIIDKDKFLLYNFSSILPSENILLNIEYNTSLRENNVVHNEYQLLTEGIADSLPTESLEIKWIDSIIGYDAVGNKVPDVKLPSKLKYGLLFRPRQSMFIDRYQVLESVLENINTILKSRAFADTINYTNLSLTDNEPSVVLNEYDAAVDELIDLQNIGTSRIQRPILQPNIVNGVIDTITIVNPGFGYKVIPPIIIEGDGRGAEAQVTLDSQGRIATVNVVNKGKNYTSAVIKIRNFTVLVRSDETINNYWSLYAYDDVRKVFQRSKAQAFNTPRYWRYVDYYASGFSITSRIIKEIDNIYQEPTIAVDVGDVIKIKEFANGGWALLLKTIDEDADILGTYKLVGRQNGTLEIIKEQFLNQEAVGFDTASTFDGNYYDIQPSIELRNILRAVKEDIFLEDLRVEWNKLFFTSIRYAFVQQPYIDWAFKTSFLNAIHNVGELAEKASYKNDNLEAFQKYIEEVKPYRTTIREYTSRYKKLESAYSVTTDFDCPPAYSSRYGEILPVNANNDRFDEYPWKYWFDNQGYSVIAIEISEPGEGYTAPPTVIIEGTGQGVTARAFISNGSVSGIEVMTQGSGFTLTPIVRLVGGNGTNPNIAKAVAVLGNGSIRSFNFNIKFDRISKTGQFAEFTQSETFIAGGFTATFDLKYAPTNDKSKITVKKNNQFILRDEYRITLYKTSQDTYVTLRGKITFLQTPAAGDLIEIVYEKNNEFLDAVARIHKYYSPNSGMKGKELPQLMTGIDFGGVQIQGTTFDVTGGWDALPWFTDNWDSVESSGDYYYVADGSTTTIDLPFVPEIGQKISIYIKRASETFPANIDTIGDSAAPTYRYYPAITGSRPIRLDDEYFGQYDGVTVQPNGRVFAIETAVMPSFVGDGINKTVQFSDPITDLPYISILPGDTLIFRTFESDGSVIINDPNIIDTRLSGGTLAAMSGAYATATGKLAEDIVIDGSGFNNPAHTPAPEENVPGQILESVSIKVFHDRIQGAAPIQSTVYVADGVTEAFDIGIFVTESKSVTVYVDKMNMLEGDSTIDYTFDWANNRVLFNAPPEEGAVVEIIAIGLGGVAILDYQEYKGDGTTKLFLTKADYDDAVSVLVTVNGTAIDTEFSNSSDFTDTPNKVIISLGETPSLNEVVKIIVLGPGLDVDSGGQSLIRVNKQVILWDGSSSRFDLDTFVSLSRASATSSIVVDVNGRQLTGPDTIRRVYDGTNNLFTIAEDPFLDPGTVTINDIEVYINNIIQPIITVWTFNTTAKLVTINTNYLTIDDEMKVIVTLNNDYNIDAADLVLTSSVISSLTIGDRIEVTWFSEYPSADIISDQYTGGKVLYQLRRKPLTSSYVWIYLNGNRLTQDQDYSVDVPRGTVKLKVNTTTVDVVKIVEFGVDLWLRPSSYEIYKDMLNIYYYKRYTIDSLIKLDKDLNYYDDSITVRNGNLLGEPNPEKNAPGIVSINNERIEYFKKEGNVLSQLRRGSYGTSIPTKHSKLDILVDVGGKENVPYTDNQERYDYVSDGSSLLIGPLDFIPEKAQRNTYRETTVISEIDQQGNTVSVTSYNSIPETNGPCDQIEVFAGGIRLRKDSIMVYEESLGASSPLADKQVEAQFTVDGESPYIRLTQAVTAGTRITVIRRLGRVWYDRGENTASTGKPLQKNTNAIAKFILGKTTELP